MANLIKDRSRYKNFKFGAIHLACCLLMLKNNFDYNESPGRRKCKRRLKISPNYEVCPKSNFGMGSAVAKNEKQPRPRVKTPPDLRRLSKNHENIRTSPSEIEISALNEGAEDVELVGNAPVTSENEVRKLIDDSWRLIERQSNRPKIIETSKGDVTNSNVVRIFVSSTFVDCHSERNVLVKEVFPELRYWCAENGLILIDVDLRWGVPAETSTSDTVQICMHELDECHKETNGQPFFLGLIGDRYGWVPSKDNLIDDLRIKYEWVPNVSITHMEILHGAYRSKNPNAAFVFRDSSSLNNVPAEFRSDFEEKSLCSKNQLQELKKRLRSRFVGGCFNYTPVFDTLDESSGRKLVKFKGYESFVENIKTFFKKRISATFRLDQRKKRDSFDASSIDRKEEPFDDVAIRRKHEQFVQESSWFVGRTEELKSLHSFVDSSIPLNCTKMPCEITDDSKGVHLFGKVPWTDKESTPYLFVKGKSGVGKSSLLAQFVSECFKKKHSNHIFFHFVGLFDESGMEENLLKRLIVFSGVDNFDTTENDRDRLIGIWKETALPKLLASKNELIIVMDALEKLNWSQSPSHLKWLPRCFPKNVRCIVSADADVIPTTCRLEETGPFRLDLSSLPDGAQKVFVDTYLSRFGKKLDAGQMKDLLVRHRTPVWLWLACEELRIFGDFRNLKNKILSLPDDLTDLSWYVVERLIREDEGEKRNVEKFLKFLSVETIGIGENYVPSLLGSFVDLTPAPYAEWIALKIRLKPFLNFNNGVINFKHYALREASEKHLVRDQKIYTSVAAVLASFYEKFCQNNRLLYYERYPFFLIKSEQKQKAVNFLFLDRPGKLMTPHYVKQKLFQDLRCKSYAMIRDKANAYVCSFCASPSSSGCTICGSFGGGSEGLLCTYHNNPYMPNCILCGKMVPSGAAGVKMGSKVVLCSFCNFGSAQCCKMLS